MFEINVEPLNFVNSHTDKGVPCNHCEAVDIPASMSIYNAMNRDLTNPWCTDSHICNTLSGDGDEALNIIIPRVYTLIIHWILIMIKP